jgi:hypothetical protein
MVLVREPVLHPIPIKELRPTQITVGMREVEAKRRVWKEQDKKKRDEFLSRHMVPVVRGPKERFYVTDHHHLSLALYKEGVKSVFVIAVADLRALVEDEFWTFLDHRGWAHPFNAKGQRCPYDEIPRHIANLKDDPYRSLAGELRRMGGFAKDTTPFSEFLWADYMRRNIGKDEIEKNFERALEQAMKLAKSAQTAYLPGWCGPHAD